MTSVERTVLLVGHDASTQARLSVRARLLGYAPQTCLTGERAIELARAQRPVAVISELLLPGASGLVTLAEIERCWPGVNTVLLSTIPPGPAEQDKARHAVDFIFVRRGAWEPSVMQAAFPDAAPAKDVSSVLAALDSEGPEPIAELIESGQLSPELEALSLEHFAATRPVQEVLPMLERAIQQVWNPDRMALIASTLALAIAQGPAGFDVIAQVFQRQDAPPDVRAQALRWLAEHFEVAALGPLIEGLMPSDELLWFDAQTALCEAAERAEDFEILAGLAEQAAAPGEVRARALRALARDFVPHRVAPLFRRLSQDPDPGMRDLVVRLIAQGDDFQVDALLAMAEAPGATAEARIAALKKAALQLPAATALPVLQRAQVNPDPRVRHCAFELALRRAPHSFEDSLARAIADGPPFVQAALLGAMGLGARGFKAIGAIAAAPLVALDVRAKALRLLALRFSAAKVLPLLKTVLEGSQVELYEPASLAAVQLGRPGLAFLYSVLSSSAGPEVRITVLQLLEQHGPADLVLKALRRASRDPVLAVRRVAVRLGARRAGAEVTPLLDALVAAEAQELFCDAVDGCQTLGLAGFAGLAQICLRPEVPIAARRQAWAALRDDFEPDTWAKLQDSLSRGAPEVLVPAADASDLASEAVTVNPTSGVPWDSTGPNRSVVPAAVTQAPVVGAWEIADTAPAHPATDEATEVAKPASPSPSEAATRPVAPAPAEATQADPPADATKPAPPATTQPLRHAVTQPMPPATTQPSWAAAIPRGISTIGRAPPPAPRSPPGPAVPLPPVGLAPSPPPVAAPGVPQVGMPDSGEQTILPSGPAPGRAAKSRSRVVSLRRAREAMQTALQMGQDGYRGIKTLARSSRIPTEVRVQALRHLAAEFSDRPVTEIFERALGSDEPALQNAALSCVLIQRDVAMEPVATLALREDAEVATRVRALRFIASRYPKKHTRSTLEGLLECQSPALRKAALESLFTSMRFIQEHQIEGALMNLLAEHDDLEVKISAAKALGIFGGAEAVSALRSAGGLFANTELKAAAWVALNRVQARAS